MSTATSCSARPLSGSSAECAGRTFVQQGCPFFAAIADNDWLGVYADELERFSRDISGYSARAWDERVGWNGGYHAWVGWWERDPLSSDQDLIQYLIHSGKLPHTDPAEFRAASDLHYVHNPLYFHTHADLSLGKTSGVEFRSDGRACFVDGRQIAFWHFQQSFVHYMRQCEVLLRLRWPFVLPHTPLSSWVRHSPPCALRECASLLLARALATRLLRDPAEAIALSERQESVRALYRPESWDGVLAALLAHLGRNMPYRRSWADPASDRKPTSKRLSKATKLPA